MSYELLYKSSVERELERLPKAVLRRIDEAIEALRQIPRPAGAIKLTGRNAYRSRVGDYRIVYTIDDQKK